MIKELFPDGTPVSEWFYDTKVPTLDELGKQYIVNAYGIFDDGKIYTKEIQALIDKASQNGGGVIVIPEGTYLTGALFFKKGVHLYVAKGATLKGSDNISDYPVTDTRIEGEWCKYYPGLINADNADGFVMCGGGTIDGNGFKAWKAFWQRREWNPNCTNKDEQRPRLVYISNSKDVTVADLNLQNSHFWTTHMYKCRRVRYLNCRIFSPGEPINAPSTDAIDIDVCTDVLIKNCYMSVNDDGIALKGGKGPWADNLAENGSNERVLIEDCKFGFCHSAFTCGSESVHNKNILIRRCETNGTLRLCTLKMRPDTPQHYEYITIEDIKGSMWAFLDVNPWTQFYDLKDRKDRPLSHADNITIRNCDCDCNTYFFVKADESQYILSDFVLEDLEIRTKINGFTKDAIRNISMKNINVTEV